MFIRLHHTYINLIIPFHFNRTKLVVSARIGACSNFNLGFKTIEMYSNDETKTK